MAEVRAVGMSNVRVVGREDNVVTFNVIRRFPFLPLEGDTIYFDEAHEFIPDGYYTVIERIWKVKRQPRGTVGEAEVQLTVTYVGD